MESVQCLDNLEKTFVRLEEALKEDNSDDLYIDGTIQRLKTTVEIYWKTLKRMLEEQGIEAKSSRETLKQAYAVDWIQNEQSWLQMLHDRNETSHVYDEEKARNIYENIVGYFPEMKKTFTFLKEKYQEDRREPHDD
ncbi:HI0074 family nucleotidyltransferase substrate-binding subunit [Oceanobacillus locisalsi]|uniref:HI0074 family nucleotidyltransferase substrate-binding subunit n=1 Tax=Oceanobacillus locisalsi TaxID=546107 RepID=A0ABW3NJT3_9BACI